MTSINSPAPSLGLPMPNYCYRAQIIRVIDGDTYDVEVDVGFRMIARLPLRLAHVDAPEHNTVEGQNTIRWVSQLFGKLPALCVVRTYKPIDKYGRYLADVFVDDHKGEWLDVGTEMVEEGFAKPYEGGTK